MPWLQISCPYCRQRIPLSSLRCPACRSIIPHECGENERRNILRIGCVLLLFLSLVVALLLSSGLMKWFKG